MLNYQYTKYIIMKTHIHPHHILVGIFSAQLTAFLILQKKTMVGFD